MPASRPLAIVFHFLHQLITHLLGQQWEPVHIWTWLGIKQGSKGQGKVKLMEVGQEVGQATRTGRGDIQGRIYEGVTRTLQVTAGGGVLSDEATAEEGRNREPGAPASTTMILFCLFSPFFRQGLL